MTRVAASRLNDGTSYLVGDVAISHSDHPGLYTNLRRKVLRVSNRLVVGWTGNQMAAEMVLTKLVAKGATVANTDDLPWVLTTFP